MYVVRQRRKTEDFSPVGWRVFVRTVPKEALLEDITSDLESDREGFRDW